MGFKPGTKVILKDGIKVGNLIVGRGQAGRVTKVIRKRFSEQYEVDFGICRLVLKDTQVR